MRIGVLGTGMVGQTIATKLVELGHEVTMGARQAGNEKALEWAAAAGDGAAREERATARRERWLERLDTDRDGRVSRGEYRAWRVSLFERLDKDKDGKLSPDELPHRWAHSPGSSAAGANPGAAAGQTS
jgi:hypothetical protein